MRKEQAKAWIDNAYLKVKGARSADEYCYGFKEGCETFLDWLIQQGVIKQ